MARAGSRRFGYAPDMRMRRRSKKRRALGAVGTYLKFKAIRKAAQGATKAVKGMAAYKATRGAARKAPKPMKALPVVAGVGVAGAVAARKRRHNNGAPESAAASTDDYRQHEATPA
jgi:hypothetical protein